MNASQLLEVATKVFVSQDQEAKWVGDRKIKRKVDLFAAALAKQRQKQSLWMVTGAPRVPLP
jgi:hypothetical protein